MPQLTDIKLNTVRYRVVIGDPEAPPDTWEIHEVQSIGRDMSRAETIFARNKWGKVLDHPIRFQDLVAWCALTRTSRIDMGWDEFEASYIECAPAEVPEGLDPDVRPTPPGLDPGY